MKIFAYHIQGGKKTDTLSLYALISSNIDLFSNLFHCHNQQNIRNNILPLKIPPQLKCVATLPCEMSVS